MVFLSYVSYLLSFITFPLPTLKRSLLSSNTENFKLFEMFRVSINYFSLNMNLCLYTLLSLQIYCFLSGIFIDPVFMSSRRLFMVNLIID